MLRVALLAVALFAGTAHADDWRVQDSGRSTILPEALDLSVIDGSFIPTNCQFETLLETRDMPADCVAFPIQTSHDFQSLYVRAIIDRGWQFAGGAANVLYFERPRSNTNCSDRMNFVGWFLGDPDEIAKYGRQDEVTMDWSRVTHAALFIMIEPAPVCGEERYVP